MAGRTLAARHGLDGPPWAHRDLLAKGQMMSTFAEQDAKLEKATEAILQATKDEKQLVRMAGRDFEDLREEIVFAGERVRKVSLRKTPKTLDDVPTSPDPSPPDQPAAPVLARLRR